MSCGLIRGKTSKRETRLSRNLSIASYCFCLFHFLFLVDARNKTVDFWFLAVGGTGAEDAYYVRKSSCLIWIIFVYSLRARSRQLNVIAPSRTHDSTNWKPYSQLTVLDWQSQPFTKKYHIWYWKRRWFLTMSLSRCRYAHWRNLLQPTFLSIRMFLSIADSERAWTLRIFALFLLVG